MEPRSQILEITECSGVLVLRDVKSPGRSLSIFMSSSIPLSPSWARHSQARRQNQHLPTVTLVLCFFTERRKRANKEKSFKSPGFCVECVFWAMYK